MRCWTDPRQAQPRSRFVRCGVCRWRGRARVCVRRWPGTGRAHPLPDAPPFAASTPGGVRGGVAAAAPDRGHQLLQGRRAADHRGRRQVRSTTPRPNCSMRCTCTDWRNSPIATGWICAGRSHSPLLSVAVPRPRPRPRIAGPAAAHAGADRWRQGFAGRRSRRSSRSAATPRRSGSATSPLIAGLRRAHRPADAQHQRELAPELVRVQPHGRLERPHPGHRGELGDPCVAAILYGYDSIAFANERSASAATLEYEGQQVNHQWSKGFAFEPLLGDWLHTHVAADLDYCSLLRPYSELAITRAFAKTGATYFDAFSSCNRNFRILGPSPADRWCGQCPKCHFVFLALAPFLPKPRLLPIFGAQPARRRKPGRRLRRADGIPGPQAVRMRRRRRRGARGDVAALSRPTGMARGRAGGTFPQRDPAAARSGRSCRWSPGWSRPANIACRRVCAGSDSMRFAELEGMPMSRSGASAAKAGPRSRRDPAPLPRQPLTLFCSRTKLPTPRGLRSALAHRRTAPDAAALAAFDVVIKSPGISAYEPALLAAQAQGTRFTSGTALWFGEHPDARVIARHRHQGQEHHQRAARAPGARARRAHRAGRQHRHAAAGTAGAARRRCG